MYKRLIFAASLLALATATGHSSAWAGWGCGAITDSGAMGRAWSAPTEAEARRLALKYCSAEGEGRCHIINCRDNIDTQDEAHALWPPQGPVDHCYGSGPCKTGN